MRAWLLVLLALAPATVAARGVPDVLHGHGDVSTFQLFAFGLALEGGLHERTALCADCVLRFTTTAPSFVVADLSSPAGAARTLDPGRYEVRELRGFFGSTQEAPHAFFVQIHGAGKLLRLD